MKAANRKTLLKGAIMGLLLIALLVASGYHIFIWKEYRVLNLFAFLLFFPLGAVVLVGVVRSCLFLKKETRKNIYLLIFSLLFILVSLELVLRFVVKDFQSYSEQNGTFFYSSLYHDQPEWYFLKEPNSTNTEQTVEFTYHFVANSMGLRNKDIPIQKAKREIRILSLGDSFTEGYGSPADSTWPALLEQNLNAGKQQKKITVINGGMSGQDPMMAYKLLKEKLLQYEPDIVLTAINYSDIQEIQVRGGFDRFIEGRIMKAKEPPKIEFWFAISYIVRHVMIRGLDYDPLMLNAEEREETKKKALALIHECVIEYGKLSKEKAFKFMAVFHPGCYDIISKQSHFRDVEAKLAFNSDIPAIDLTWYFINEAKIDSSNEFNYFWPIDGHYKPAGNQVFAEGVARKIEELNWLQQDTSHYSLPD